jgi:putative transposase
LKPAREHATNNAQTYFVTSDTWERRALLRADSWARLFFKTLLSHRGESYLLHEFVLMPDHFHLLISPMITLERAVQLIKGGFSYRAKKEPGSNAEIWQRGFADHRIRDSEDYDKHLHYIHLNPVRKHLCASPAGYRYSSTYPGWKLDPIPQRLKPPVIEAHCGTAEAVPFQNGRGPIGMGEAESFQGNEKTRQSSQDISLTSDGVAKIAPFQSTSSRELQKVSYNHATQK